MRTRLFDQRFGLVLSFLCSCVGLGSNAAVAAIPQTRGNLIVEVRKDDWSGPIGQLPVTVIQGSTNVTQTTDAQGATKAASVILTNPVRVRLAEVAMGWGQTVGEEWVLTPYSVTRGAGNLRSVFYQAQARSATIDPYNRTHDGVTSRWMFEPIVPGDFSACPSQIAWLPTTDVVRAYHDYRGVQVSGFALGLLVRVAADCDLGTNGVAVTLDATGKGFVSTPAVKPEYIGSDAGGIGFSSIVKGFDPTNETVQVLLTGKLHVGDNLLLVDGPVGLTSSSAGDAGLESDPDAQLPKTPSRTSVATCSTTLAPGQPPDCTPPAPSCTSTPTCPPQKPEHDCGAIPTNGPICGTSADKIGSRLCAAAGTTVSDEECTNWQGGVSVGVKVGTGFGELSVGADGKVGGQKCLTITVQGGYCAQGWQCIGTCESCWEVCLRGWFSGARYYDLKCTSCQTIGAASTTTCQ